MSNPYASKVETDRIEELHGDILDEPEQKTIFTIDATGEAMSKRMNANGGCLGVLSGEARKVLSIAKGRYSEDGDIDIWLKGFSGDYLRIDRSTKDPIEIPNPCLSALLAVQPDALSSIMKSPVINESGFSARWFFVNVPLRNGEYPINSVPADVKENFNKLIEKLANLRFAISKDGKLTITLSQDAFTLWKEYHDEIHREILNPEDMLSTQHIEWLAKLPENAARIALILHMFEEISGRTAEHIISKNEMARALVAANFFKSQAAKTFKEVLHDKIIEQAEKILKWIRKNLTHLQTERQSEKLGDILAVKSRDLIKYKVGGLSDTSSAEIILGRLAEYNWIRRTSLQLFEGKKPHILYLINPKITEEL